MCSSDLRATALYRHALGLGRWGSGQRAERQRVRAQLLVLRPCLPGRGRRGSWPGL